MDRRQFLKTTVAGAAALGLQGCESPVRAQNPSSIPSDKPHILVVVMDTVRQDHLSCYGYERETSPYLESVLAESRIYHNSYSTANWTVPSHASLFTGLHPTSHGCRWGNLWFDEELVALPETLQQHGYHTIGLAENTAIRGERGYDQGWDVLENPSKRSTETASALVVRLRELLAGGPEKPTFTFLNLLAAHKPYKWSGNYRNHYLSDPSFEDFVEHPDVTSEEPPHLDPKPLRHLIEHYDASIRFVDAQIEMVVDLMKKSGMWDNTLAFFVADHGESLGEHFHFGHQFYLYEELVRIPYIVRWPGEISGGETRDGAVSLVDIVPTIHEMLNITNPEGPIQGLSLLSNETSVDRPMMMENYLHEVFREDTPDGRGRDFSEKTEQRFAPPYVRERFARAYKSLIVGDTKLIRANDGRTELYNLTNDPGELNNLAESADHADLLANTVANMDSTLEEFRAMRNADDDVTDLNEQTIEDLEALGYL